MRLFQERKYNDDRGVFVEVRLADDEPAPKEVTADFEKLEELGRERLFIRSGEA